MPLTSTRITDAVAMKKETMAPPETTHVVKTEGKETTAKPPVKEVSENTMKKTETEGAICSNANSEEQIKTETKSDENKTGKLI